MALTGICLVLFVTFHVLMNAVALIWPTAYNQVCEFLGANWYALIASIGLAVLFIIHIIYALWLTVQNRAARGSDRYAVTSRPKQVEWASKNMLVLGIVVLAFLVVHLIQFWAKMQLVELRHAELSVLPQLDGAPAAPAMGTLFIQMAFSHWYTPVIYIIGFVALWFHMNHGFWSMFHTVGWDNNIWIERLKKIGCWWTSIVVLLFMAQAIVFTVKAHDKYYTTDVALRERHDRLPERHLQGIQGRRRGPRRHAGRTGRLRTQLRPRLHRACRRHQERLREAVPRSGPEPGAPQPRAGSRSDAADASVYDTRRAGRTRCRTRAGRQQLINFSER